MENYTIDYRWGIGSFLDWKEIEWTTSADLTSVTFTLGNDEQFASLIFDYSEWLKNTWGGII